MKKEKVEKDPVKAATTRSDGEFLTTNQGLKINDDQNSLKAGERGPTLLEDFILREKITHFDHERIPERVVHARGSAAHGFFQVYKPLAKLTKAAFLQDPEEKTPVFVRFSTVAGSRGSSDLARDVRGFAVKFYTREGNFDLVGNNMPVFFIQDAIKFPDLIHAVKPEPQHEMPQAASAHDTFWDFISLTPESMHMVMWAMSDRALPRSLRMMEGFGVHTFRLIDSKGVARFVKFHWKPILGLHSVVWEEAQIISGKDPDFHRRDLWEAIDTGNFPEWELGFQVVEEKDEHNFDFDLLDPTKLIPEELVPVQRVGKLTLNRNPDNFFAETEQVAFHTGHLVPGLDFTNDPLLQGRLFSYLDTQLIRLGGPNFHEIPINRPRCPFSNNQRDGHMRQTINAGQTSYGPNALGNNFPKQAKEKEGGFVSYTERIDAHKIRGRSKSFLDHFSQATLFYKSQTPVEQGHIAQALQFELGKVETIAIREKIVGLLKRVDKTLAHLVADGIGVSIPKETPPNRNIPADGIAEEYASSTGKTKVSSSDALSIVKSSVPGVKTLKVAILAADGVDEDAIKTAIKTLRAAGAVPKIVAPKGGHISTTGESSIKVDFTFLTTSSVLFDAVFVPKGKKSLTALEKIGTSVHFVQEAYRHFKTIGGSNDVAEFIKNCVANSPEGKESNLRSDTGLIFSKDLNKQFLTAMAKHRHWDRFTEQPERLPG
jgi:catalase